MSGKSTKLTKQDPTIALCYIRLSWTREAKDSESPDRQRANILRVCEQNGWTPEFYEDAEGHKSGTTEKNRPGWLALKSRLADPDIAALVANDLSRLHRKGWRIGDLLDFVDEHEVKLVLAAQGKQIDFSTPLGRLMVQVGALFDEWYAKDIGQRSRDSIQYRKSEGKTVGIPPFGTKRDEKGYLIPTESGAWLLADGAFVRGKAGEAPPAESAVWRGFYEAAYRVLELYATGMIGIDKVAYRMQKEGWAYRNRAGDPIAFESDAVRRVVANWPEYGGHVSTLRAKERHPYKYPLENYVLNPDRAVYPIELLYRVGKARYDRTLVRTIDDGQHVDTHPYPLLGLLYCHHCDLLAGIARDPKRRTRLGGKNKTQDGRYRHKHGLNCGCKNRSIRRDIIENDFGRLIELLWVNTEQVEAMALLNVRALGIQDSQYGEKVEAEKRAAIAKCNRRIAAAQYLFEDGDISREEYLRRKDQNEREIAHWEARTAETDRVALELTMCQEVVERIAQSWRIGSDEDRQGLVRSLFEEVVVNLDTQRITGFKLKPWADTFVALRAALYADQEQGGGKKPALEGNQGLGTAVTPTGLCPSALHSTPAPPLTLTSSRLPRSVMNRSAHGFRRKPTICWASRSYTM
ncbi:MAG: recombinase family protein [Chloroflexi bacterium]|nr:recombinase family protein [Chloroflexota bacterium]